VSERYAGGGLEVARYARSSTTASGAAEGGRCKPDVSAVVTAALVHTGVPAGVRPQAPPNTEMAAGRPPAAPVSFVDDGHVLPVPRSRSPYFESGKSMQRDSVSFTGVLLRFVVAMLLVYGTWNPEGVSYYSWALAPFFGAPATAGPMPFKFLVGVVLVAGWAVFLNATRRSLGVAGALLAVAITVGVIWLLAYYNVVSVSSARGFAHAALIALALLLSVGMSWAFFSRRISGQIDTDVTE
jgi:hypothetical protein